MATCGKSRTIKGFPWGLIEKVKESASMDQHQKIAEDFYKYQMGYFQILGVWKLPGWASDQERRFQALRFSFILVILSWMLLLFALELMSNISDLREILKVFFMFSTEMSCMTKLMHLRLKCRKLAGLVEMMRSPKFATKSQEEKEVMESGREAVVLMRNLYGVSSLITASLILLVPCFIGFEELPLTMFEVCDSQESICYWLQYLFHSVSLMSTCVLNIAYDTVSYSLLTYLKVQLQMLVLRLEKLGPAAGPEENERISEELRECAEYYNRIVDYKKLVELFIQVPGSVQLMCSILVLVSNFFGLSTMSVANGEFIQMVKICIYQVVMLWQIFIVCYASNEVTLHSAGLCNGIYKSQWMGWNRRNRRLILLMMQRFNSPLQMRTLNSTLTFGLEAFGSVGFIIYIFVFYLYLNLIIYFDVSFQIVNCSYSYFALLKRVNS